MAGIRIDALNTTNAENRLHELAAMKDGLTVKLSVAQMLGLIIKADILGLLNADDIVYDAGPDSIKDVVDAIATTLLNKLNLNGSNIGANGPAFRTALALGYATATEKMTHLTNLGATAFDCGTAYIDSGAIKFYPLRGNLLQTANGAVVQIPSAGLSLAVTGAAASTVYYIYAWDSNADGVLDNIEFSATVPAYSGGVRVKTGAADRIFIAIAYTNSTPAWLLCRSWFNRTPAIGLSTFTTARTVSSLAYSEVHTEIRQTVLALAGDILDAAFESPVNMGAGGNRGGWGISIDGAVSNQSLMEIIPDGSGIYPSFVRRLEVLTEGVHTISVSAIVSSNNLIFRPGATAGGYPCLKTKLGI